MYSKRGPLSQEDQDKVVKWAGEKPLSEIARLLDRDPKSIDRWIKKHMPNYLGSPDTIDYDLNKSEKGFRAVINKELKEKSSWKQLKQEFSPKELDIFQEKYAEFISQFKNDILPSERMQIFHLIKAEILSSRCLQAQYRIAEEIQRIESEQDRFNKKLAESGKDPVKADREYILSLDEQLNIRRKSVQELSKEYNTLQKNQADLMKTLKATRDQRVKDIQEKPVDFISLIKLLQDQEVAQREGRQMELFRLAGENSYEKLQQEHEYMDKNVDKPFLIPED